MPDPVVPPVTPPAVRTQAVIEAELASLPDPDRILEPGEGTPTPPAVGSQTPAEAEEADFIDQASRKGWVPKDKYTGPADKWVDAKTFIQRGERFTKNLVREVEGLKRQLADFEGTKAAFVKFHNETLEKKDKELKDAITQLRIQRSAATRDGDDEGAVALEDRIEVLEGQRKEIKAIPVEATPKEGEAAAAKPPGGGPNPNDPVLLEWIEDGNTWFNDDETLRKYAVELGEGFIKDGTKLRGRPFLDFVAEKMRENFPRKFKLLDGKSASSEEAAPAARRSTAEGSGSSATGARTGAVNGKTEADLPAEDLKLMRQFIKEGYTTKEKFLAGYFSR